MLVKTANAIDLTTIYSPAKVMGGDKATLSTLLSPIFSNVLIVSGIVALFTLLFSGFMYINSNGDKAKTAQAAQMLNYGIIGLVVVVAAYVLTKIMSAVLGFNFI